MASNIAKIKSLNNHYTLKVIITSQFKIRTFLFINLIKFACWIMKCNVEMGIKEQELQ